MSGFGDEGLEGGVHAGDMWVLGVFVCDVWGYPLGCALAIEVGVAKRSADGRDVLLVISIGHL